MWFFGFSTTNPKKLWIIGAIILVIFLTLILKKMAIHLESKYQESRNSSPKTGDIESGKCHKGTSKNGTICTHCCVCGDGVIRTFALEELKVATRNFRIRIGVGATSYVYLAEMGDGRFGAVKRVMEERGGNKKIFLDEVSVLLRISHPNLVGLLGFCLEKGEQLLLLEYVPNKSLYDRLHTRYGQSLGVLSWRNRLSIALNVARALDYLHSTADPPVIHRDIKSSNILLVDDNHAKLADFGLCKLGHDTQIAQTPTSIKGSLGYVDTQYLNTGRVSTKSDVYSFGVLLLELITGLKSLQGTVTLVERTEEWRRKGNLEVLVGVLDPKLNGDVDMEQVRLLVDVANLALVDNSEARPEMSQILYMISSCVEGEQLLLLEYVPNKSLYDRLHTRYGQSLGVLSWRNRLSIALNVARALDYLHSTADPPVIHRDIKSSNILLVDDNHAKLADFGLCKLGHDTQIAQTPTSIKGSLGYVDTQYLNTGRVSTKSDVYSFGVLLLELITGLKSLQGTVTLVERTEEWRRKGNLEVLVGVLDPKLNGDVDMEQVRLLVDVANLALVDNSEARPEMSQILYMISSCVEGHHQLQTDLRV